MASALLPSPAHWIAAAGTALHDPWIGALFGVDVRTGSCRTRTDLLPRLHPVEAAIAACFAAKRRREFAVGRMWRSS